MIIYLNLDEKRKCRKKREKGEILFHLGSNIFGIFENLLTGVVAGLECCDTEEMPVSWESRAI